MDGVSLAAQLDQLSAKLTEALGDQCRVEVHDGVLSVDDLRRFAQQQAPVCALAAMGGGDIQVAGRDRLSMQVEFIASIIASNGVEAAFRSAADIAMRVLWTITRAADWGDSTLFRSVQPKDVRADNLFSGAIDDAQGINLWGVAWTQTCYLTRS